MELCGVLNCDETRLVPIGALAAAECQGRLCAWDVGDHVLVVGKSVNVSDTKLYAPTDISFPIAHPSVSKYHLSVHLNSVTEVAQIGHLLVNRHFVYLPCVCP
jgi:hypothetical protein